MKKTWSKNVYIGKGKLAGKGVYAARNFKKGEKVMDFNLKPLTQNDFNKLPKDEHKFVHTFSGKMYLFPEPARYTNHSSKPNMAGDYTKMNDYAITDIKKGEMVTVNATLEVRKEIESFIKTKEKSATDFKWLSGGYRNAVVSYKTSDGKRKKVTLKRIAGNWHNIN